MSDFKLNVKDYLDRINYHGKTEVSADTLRALHIAHTLNVPFENLDVYDRKPILLDKESLYKKIVHNKRGGYCFEMNGLFSAVLKELGFKVSDLLARGAYQGIFTAKLHQALLVEIEDERWLVDVGFGNEGLTAPLLLQEGIDQPQFTQTYRLLKEPKLGYVLQRKTGDGYADQYAFTLDARCPEDFLVSNHFTATYPDSFFVTTRFCTMPTEKGRITLTEEHFINVENGQVFETKITTEAEFNKYLKEYFGLVTCP